ncbi:hypothetical protein O9929_24240 [Vibrio lentus]|nr:hypothetical protein [Vibrio lentus]
MVDADKNTMTWEKSGKVLKLVQFEEMLGSTQDHILRLVVNDNDVLEDTSLATR